LYEIKEDKRIMNKKVENRVRKYRGENDKYFSIYIKARS
jgi:hypothetical protein